jgi:hypothetical protein
MTAPTLVNTNYILANDTDVTVTYSINGWDYSMVAGDYMDTSDYFMTNLINNDSTVSGTPFLIVNATITQPSTNNTLSCFAYLLGDGGYEVKSTCGDYTFGYTKEPASYEVNISLQKKPN